MSPATSEACPITTEIEAPRPDAVAAAIRAHLGAQLRGYFSLPAREALPERLSRLVSRIEAALAVRQPAAANAFRDTMMSAIPALRTFAFSLCGDPNRSDDLVQDTLVRAWANQQRFQAGSNMIAWLFTILRNQFYSDLRKRRREIEDADGSHAGRMIAAADQEGVVALKTLYAAIDTLPAAQREALLLVGAEGYTYEQAADRLDCKVGTVKSRVSRARAQLADRFGTAEAC